MMGEPLGTRQSYAFYVSILFLMAWSMSVPVKHLSIYPWVLVIGLTVFAWLFGFAMRGKFWGFLILGAVGIIPIFLQLLVRPYMLLQWQFNLQLCLISAILYGIAIMFGPRLKKPIEGALMWFSNIGRWLP